MESLEENKSDEKHSSFWCDPFNITAFGFAGLAGFYYGCCSRAGISDVGEFNKTIGTHLATGFSLQVGLGYIPAALIGKASINGAMYGIIKMNIDEERSNITNDEVQLDEIIDGIEEKEDMLKVIDGSSDWDIEQIVGFKQGVLKGAIPAMACFGVGYLAGYLLNP